MLRFNLGLFPAASRQNAWWIMILALIGIIYGALVALVQPNMKKLIAYSSVSHLGFVVLGIFSFTQAGINGAMFVMLAHGISTGALFMLAGILHERRHTYEISEFLRAGRRANNFRLVLGPGDQPLEIPDIPVPTPW